MCLSHKDYLNKKPRRTLKDGSLLVSSGLDKLIKAYLSITAATGYNLYSSILSEGEKVNFIDLIGY